MKNFRTRTYLFLILGLPFLCMLVIVLVSARLRLSEAREAAIGTAESTSLKSAQIALVLIEHLNDYAQVVSKINLNPSCDTQSHALLESIHSALDASVNDFYGIAKASFTKEGVLLCNTGLPPLHHASIQKRVLTYLSQETTRQDRFFILNFYDATSPVYGFFSESRNSKGELVGYVAIFAPIEHFVASWTASQAWERPLLYFNNERALSKQLATNGQPSPPVPLSDLYRFWDAFFDTIAKKESHGAFISKQPIGTTDWSLVLRYPAEAAYFPIQETILYQSAFFLLFSLISLFFGARLARYYENAIQHFVLSAKSSSPSELEPPLTGILEIDQGTHQLYKWRSLQRSALTEAKMWQAAASGSHSGIAVIRFRQDDDVPALLIANPAFLTLVNCRHFSPGVALFPSHEGTILADEALIAEMQRCFRHDYPMSREVDGLNADNLYVHALATLSPLPCGFEWDPVGGGLPTEKLFVLTLDDMTEVYEREVQLARQATTDALTNLPNRQLFTDRLVQTLELSDRSKQKAAIALIDIDRFKMINDTMGHEAGDSLIRMVASRIGSRMHQGDTLCRLGGDEFGIVMGGAYLGFEEISNFIENIREAFDEPFLIHAQEMAVSCSMGVSLFPTDGSDPGTLLKRADIALGRAKESGRGSAQFFSHEMRIAFEEHVTLEQELKGAIRRGEIQIHYQPKVTLPTGKPFGMEALARWHHPTMGWVPPSKFIPLAEESGIISIIGLEAMRIAIRDAKKLWDHGFRNMPVAVNVSARQISIGFLDEIKALLNEAQLPPKMLHAEITESLIMPNSSETQSFLEGLSALGIGIALDDFGTGWSSLSILKHLPLNYLKIDRSFVVGLGRDTSDEAITTAIISMAKALDLKVIAEGVETNLQQKRLEALGVDIIQGFIVSKAKSIDDLLLWLNSGCPFDGEDATVSPESSNCPLNPSR